VSQLVDSGRDSEGSSWSAEPPVSYGESQESYAGGLNGRMPPQDADAEQSVLGAMMLSKDAIADVNERIKGPDFYRPAHESIYDAIVELY
jgi:replicative DNA helicase